MGRSTWLLMLGILLFVIGCTATPPPLPARQKAFFQAIEKGDVAKVKAELDAHGKWANLHGDYGFRPLPHGGFYRR